MGSILQAALIQSFLALHFCPEIGYELLSPLVDSVHLRRSHDGFPHIIGLTGSAINITIPGRATTSFLIINTMITVLFLQLRPSAGTTFLDDSLVGERCLPLLLLDDLGAVEAVELEGNQLGG
nr:hypothetical protein Iba_chr07dCG1200 [Ipomoea batatas]